MGKDTLGAAYSVDSMGRTDWPIVTYPRVAGLTNLFLLDSGREILEGSSDRGGWVVEVPLGYLLTEMTAGRVQVPQEQMDAFMHERLKVFLLATFYLSDKLPGPHMPSSFQKKPPYQRYLQHWRAHLQREMEKAWRTALGKNEAHRDDFPPPFDLYRYVRETQDLVLDPMDTVARWKAEHKITVPESSAPLECSVPGTLLAAAYAELWWLVRNNRRVRTCLACEAFFAPKGARWWRQQYCPRHQTGAVRQRLYLQRHKQHRRSW